MARSQRVRLRRRTTSTVDAGSIRETGQEDAEGGDDADHVRNAQPAATPPVAPPTPSHVPDAAQSFDPWGIRTSTS